MNALQVEATILIQPFLHNGGLVEQRANKHDYKDAMDAILDWYERYVGKPANNKCGSCKIKALRLCYQVAKN